MASVYKEIHLNRSANDVWDAVRDYGAVHERLFPGLLASATLDGDARVVTFISGTVVRELIVSVDDQHRRLVYASVGGRVTHHNASIQVLDDVEHSRVVWVTDILPHELGSFASALVEQGAAIMKQTLEGSCSETSKAICSV